MADFVVLEKIGADNVLANSNIEDILPIAVAIPVIPASYDDQAIPLRENAGNNFHKSAMKLTTEFDSEDSIVSSKFSLKLNGSAKLKGSFAVSHSLFSNNMNDKETLATHW